MFKQFNEFFTKSNSLALAVGVVIGAATGKLVTGVVSDLVMPVISLVLPAGDWREKQIILKSVVDAAGKETVTAIKYGDLVGTAIDFFIIAFIVFLITKALVPAMKDCPECLERIPLPAKKCRACGTVQA